MKKIEVLSLLLFVSFSAQAYTDLGNSVLRSDGSAADTQAAINAAADGGTVLIPAGTFTWGSSISIRNKAVKVQGAGGGALVGDSTSSQSVGSGTKTFTTQANLPIQVGQTVRAIYKANGTVFMQGTVASYSGTTLQVNVSSTGGNGSFGFWTLAVMPATTIVNSAANNWGLAMIYISEAAGGSVELSGICFTRGTAANGNHVNIGDVPGARPVLIHDCWFSTGGAMGRSVSIASNRGIIYKCSFDCGFWSGPGSGQGFNNQGITFKWENDPNAELSWRTPPTMGMADTTGLNNFYIENCYFAALYLQAMDFDTYSRAVVRYNTFDNSAIASHGWETSIAGVRHFEIYNNRFIFNNMGTATYGMNWWVFIRGGTGVITDNDMPDIRSTQWGDKGEIIMVAESLRRPTIWINCPVSYPAPHQVGQGHNGVNYVLDPLYIWNNAPATGCGTTDYEPDECGHGLRSRDFIKPGRDYILGTPRPGYVKYTYPHPLRTDGRPSTDPPSITLQPQAVIALVGQQAIFTVGASGANPLSYQWQKNSASISGATASSYTISSPQVVDAGSFRCIVRNQYGSVTSSVVALTVNVPIPVAPNITTNPVTVTRTVGQSATFMVAATGDAPLSYQWQKNQANISGATSASYTIASVQTNDAGSFRCVVTNPVGSANSSAATLTVSVPVPVPASITSNPQNASRTVGQSVTFTVTAIGNAPLTYQWQKNQVNIPGANSASYSIVNLTTNDAGSFRCVVANSLASATSSPATLSIDTVAPTNLHYVDATAGNDGNSGSAAHPWLHCPGMVGWTGSATLQPGDIVYFDRSDTWDMGANANGPGLDLKAGVHYIGDEWDPEGAGTGRAMLRATARQETGVVRFWEDHATLVTWLDGFEINANGQRENLIDINHSFWKTGLTKGIKRVENCIAHDNTGNGSQNDYKYGIIVSDASPDASGWVANVEILNTVVYNVARDGICAYPTASGMISNIVVRGCQVYNTGNDPSYAEGHGLLIKGNVKNSVFEYCYSHDVDSSAVFINGPGFGTGPGPSGCTVRYCVLQSSDNNGVIRIYGTGTKSLDIYGNLILENEATGGLSFAGNEGSITARIYNNTFYNSFVDIGNPTSTGTIEFKNNIIYELDDVPLTDGGSDITSHANNLYFRVGGGTLVNSGQGVFAANNLSSYESGAVTGDPLFKNAANLPTGFTGSYGVDLAPSSDGFSLQGSSPAINAGIALNTPFGGSISSIVRPAGIGWDIGAYEVASSQRPSRARNLRVVQ